MVRRRRQLTITRGRLFLLALVIVTGAQSAGAVTAEEQALAGRITQLDREMSAWAARQGDGRLPVVAPVEREREWRRFDAALSAVERAVWALESGESALLRRKVRILRARWAPSSGARPVAFERVGSAANGPRAQARVVRGGPSCALAEPIGEEVVTWRWPRSEGEDLLAGATEEAWFRLDPRRSGSFVAHTRGSRADTEIEVFSSCSAPRSAAANDDLLGLQSAVGFSAESGYSLWLRVGQRAGRKVDPMVLTIGGPMTGLSGTVTESATGSPIPGVRVEIRERSTGGFVGQDNADENGDYSLVGLDPGIYVALTEFSDDHLDELWDDQPCDDSCDPQSGDPIVVVGGEVTTGIDFALLRAGSINGRLRDDGTGEVLPGVNVRLEDSTGGFAGSVSTDAAGRYTLGGLTPGDYFAYTQAFEHRNEVWDDFPCTDGHCEPLEGTPITVGSEQAVQGIDFELDRLGSISGNLVDASTGLPVSFAPVAAYDGSGDFAAFGSTDAAGDYLMGGLESGTYFVSTEFFSGYRNEAYDDVECGGKGSGDCQHPVGLPIAVSFGETIAGIDFALERLAIVAGRVVDEGTGDGIRSMDVLAWSPTRGVLGSGTTGGLGDYLIEDLAPDEYYVLTDNELGYLDELFDDLPCWGFDFPGCDPQVGTPVALELGEVASGIDFGLTLGGAISGALTDATTGEPIFSVFVKLWDAVGAEISGVGADQEGLYSIGALPSASYFLTAESSAYLDELWDDLPCDSGSCDPTTGSPIAVSAGATTGAIDFALVLRGGLSGVVSERATGLPLAGVGIDVWDSSGTHVGTAASNANGRYQVDLSSGSFHVSTDATPAYVDEIYDDVACPNGPAILGLCDPSSGELVPVIGFDPVVEGIDFALASPIFADGFESGDTSAWSMAVP